MFLRSVVRTALLVLLLTTACVDGHLRRWFCGMRPGPAGAVWVHGWCRRILRMMKIGCEVEGAIPQAGTRGLAVVCNHLSYLDILLFSAIRPFVMVAKTEVRGWPLIGWITAQAGTVYVQRADYKGGRTQTHADVNAAMAVAFRSGLPVLFFPEGTTTDGSEILTFRRGLFNSVVHDRVPVQTAALAYQLTEENLGATVGQHVCYWGEMVFGPHLFRCLGLKGIKGRVRFDAGRFEHMDRFALALGTRARIVEGYEFIRDEEPHIAPDVAALVLT